MPLTIRSKGRPNLPRTRGKPRRFQDENDDATAADVDEISAIATEEADEITTMPPPRIPRRKKVPKARTLVIMEEMLLAVRRSEDQCLHMSQAFDKKLAELNTSNTSRHTSRRQPTPTGPPSNTSTPRRMATSDPDVRTDLIDQDWDDIIPDDPPHISRTQKTSQRQLGPGGYSTSRHRQNIVKPPAMTAGAWHDASPINRRQEARPFLATEAPPPASDAAAEALRMIAAAAQNKSTLAIKKKGIPVNYVFPYDLVDRGDNAKSIGKGEASKDEYILGLKRMESHPTFPANSLLALSQHQEAIAQDNCTLPWAVVRRYSEETFLRIADGRLPEGWLNPMALEVVRLGILATANLLTTDPAAPHRQQGRDPKNPYDKDTNGAPCLIWNRDPDRCDKAAKGESHGSGAQKLSHICGFCANVRHIVAHHPENRCYAKKARAKHADKSNPQDFGQ